MRKINHLVPRSVLALGVLFTLSRAAFAGPALICHSFDAGDAPVLPWSSGSTWNSPDPSYDIERLTADTMRLLSADAPIMARMETLRRATIYATKDRRITAELLSAVLGRALTTAADGSRDSLAWFDAGYLIETYRQASLVYRWDMLSGAERSAWTLRSEPEALDGYRFVRKAIDLEDSNAEMEFAASLMKEGAASAEHRRRAVAGANAGSLLARNLDNR
ncbi:MAG: hypothetical protein GEV06_20195 [Luteitalea sp.]|nr:hypothetical protein [Luteitalea sp.]